MFKWLKKIVNKGNYMSNNFSFFSNVTQTTTTGSKESEVVVNGVKYSVPKNSNISVVNNKIYVNGEKIN